MQSKGFSGKKGSSRSIWQFRLAEDELTQGEEGEMKTITGIFREFKR